MSLVVAPLAKFSWLLARQAGCDRFKRTSEVDMWMVKLVMNIGSVMKLFAPQAQAQVKHPFNHSHTRGTCYALKRVRNAPCLVVKTAIVQPEATLMESNFEAQSVRKERNILAMPDPSDLSEFQSPRTQCALEDELWLHHACRTECNSRCFFILFPDSILVGGDEASTDPGATTKMPKPLFVFPIKCVQKK